MSETNLPQFLCGVIPSYMLEWVADHGGDEASGNARATLDQMREHAARGGNAFRESLSVPDPEPDPSGDRQRVYDAGSRHELPGRLVLPGGDFGAGDLQVTEAWDGSGAALKFFEDVFQRNSIDGRGMRIDSTVHYGTGFANAMWNGRQMVYGDGDGQLFTRFTSSIDVIAHELMHGVTQHTAALRYSGQTGALNEHLSDAFGIMARQFTLGQTADQSDWCIGAGLFGPAVRGGSAVRCLALPGSAYDDPILGRDPQPSHMRGYVITVEDHGGVHINSGILNHGFYIAAVIIGGKTWKVLGPIWYVVLTRCLGPEADFHDFARATVEIAGELYGQGGRIQRILAGAWGDVGLDVPLATCEHPERLERRWRIRRPRPSRNRRSTP